jgi:hypothetical protein
MAQALRAPGNLQAGMQTIKGIHHTLSVWTDEAAMRRYLVSGDRHAMAAFRSMATGRTMGFYADKAPDWSEVHELWLSDGKDV